MTRVVLVVALLVALTGGAYWLGGRDDRLKGELNNRDTLERMEDATDDNLDDSGITKWLLENSK